MRILVLNYEYPPLGGGAGPVAKDIAEGMVSRGIEIDLVTMHYKGLPIKEVINGVNIFRVKCLRKKKATCSTKEMISYVIRAIPFVLKLTKRKKYDIVHSHFIIPSSLVAYILKRIRGLNYIISVHGSDVPGFNPDRFTFEHNFTKPILRLMMKNAKITIPLSNYLKSLIQENVSSKYPLSVIPNGINIDKFKPGIQKQNSILMTGRLLPRKGFQNILKALNGIEADGWEVHIAGDGPNRAELESLAKKLSIPVQFHGWLPNYSEEFLQLYKKAQIFCLPSLNENASISLLEAMLAKMAVITSNITGCPETIGEAGILVEPENVDEIRKALNELINSPKKLKNLSETGYKRVITKFDREKIIDKYLNFLQN